MSDSTANPAQTEAPRPTWGETLKVYLEPATLRMLFLGFSAGLPLLLVLGTLSFRLREAGIDRATIGYLSWVGLAYGVKWTWAPLVDRLPIPLLTGWLGRRRSWLLLAQAVIMAGLVGMALVDPKAALDPIVWCAIVVAFGSATQDIALDAFRIESANMERQGALAAATRALQATRRVENATGKEAVFRRIEPEEHTQQHHCRRSEHNHKHAFAARGCGRGFNGRRRVHELQPGFICHRRHSSQSLARCRR